MLERFYHGVFIYLEMDRCSNSGVHLSHRHITPSLGALLARISLFVPISHVRERHRTTDAILQAAGGRTSEILGYILQEKGY
jgi:hypothetical protein